MADDIIKADHLRDKAQKTGVFIGKGSPVGCIYGKRYAILGDDDHDTYRVIDETGEDYLYSKSSFTDIREAMQSTEQLEQDAMLKEDKDWLEADLAELPPYDWGQVPPEGKPITTDQNVLCGKPFVKGTRISVEMIMEKLAKNMSHEYIMRQYDIEEQDIRAALAYAQTKEAGR